MKFHQVMIALSLATAGAAFAQTSESSINTPRIDKREARQDQRIYQGVANGSLTATEATRLNNGQTRVDNMQTKAASDGSITKRERAHIHHVQNKQSRHIKRQKHDKQSIAPAAG